MKSLLIISTLLLSLVSYSQKNEYFIGLDYSGSLYNGSEAQYGSFNFSPGVELQSGFCFSFGLGYFRANTISNFTDVQRKSAGLEFSFSASKRLLKGITKLSPLIGVTVGNTFYNKHLMCYNNTGELDCDLVSSYENPRIDKFRFYAKAKFMLDLRLKYFNIRLGPTYSFQEARMINDPKERSKSRLLNGYGLEGGFIFPLAPRTMKKGFFIPGRGLM